MTTPGKDESYRDKISTVDEDGKRVWIHPKKPSGKWYDRRTYVSYLLLILLFSGPFIRIGGEPLLMFNVLERKFVLFGQVFWPQDFNYFAFAMITLVVFVILFTVTFGRLFCGWICPQTIFMEMLFRKIEYAIDGDWKQQQALKKQAWNGKKIGKRALKYSLFYAISFVIANVFLAYIIGSEELFQIISDSPANHKGGLAAIVIFSFIFFFVFSYFREQVCTSICPYGRLQGVLLDKNSIIITYDEVRGENRGLFKKGEDRKAAGKGDCIDCGACVHVCPTGIDIRNGTQLECINCTACIDACNFMMEKTGLEQGLIRYDSDAGIKEGKTFTFTPKMKAYTTVLGLLVVIFFALIFSRGDIQTTILKARGQVYQERPDSTISNLYNFIVINKSNEDLPIHFKIEKGKGKIEVVGQAELMMEKQSSVEGAMFIIMDRADLTDSKMELEIGVYSGKEKLEEVDLHFTGPKKHRTLKH